MATGAAIVAAAAGLAGAGASAYGAHKQRQEAREQRRELRKQQEEEKRQALADRKAKIDALREGGIGLTTGRRTLLTGSELGMTSQSQMDGINNKLG